MHVTKSILKKVYQKRGEWSHKGDFGRLLVIAGSRRHTGSPIFVSLAAYRAGCDLVFLVGPERAMDVAASYSPVLITEPLEGTQLERKHVQEILKMVEEVKPTAVAIGPGLWRTQETREAIVKLIEQISLPMVIDADAIRAISVAKEKLRNKKSVLTPHASEFYELSGRKISTNLRERIKTVMEEAKKINSTIVLKGHIDIISDGKRISLNKTGSPYLTKGGCGDTLTGICGAFLSRRVDSFTAACAATFVNGKAGEIAAKKYGEGLLPTDLIESIPEVINKRLFI